MGAALGLAATLKNLIGLTPTSLSAAVDAASLANGGLAASAIQQQKGKYGGFGIQVFGGSPFNDVTPSSPGATWEFAWEIPQPNFGSVNLLLGRGTGPQSFSAQSTVYTVPSLAALDSAITGIDALFSGVNSSAHVAPAASLVDWNWSDDIELVPVPRSDGGTKLIVVARVFYNVTSALKLVGTQTPTPAVYDNWATRPQGFMRVRRNSTAGDQRTATSGWVLDSAFPDFGMAFSFIGRSITVASAGDSIDEAIAADYRSASQTLRATEMLNVEQSSIVYNHMNLGLAGAPSSRYLANAHNMFDMGMLPDILVFPCGTPNDGAPLTDTMMATAFSRTQQIVGLCRQNGVRPIIRAMHPANYAAVPWGASDTKRLAYNTQVAAYCAANGIIFVDSATPLAGAVDGNGQQTFTATYTNDGLHPNSAGIELIAPLFKAAIKSAVVGAF